MNIAGCVVLVTGAASGLGEATARLMAMRGARVAVLDRDADGARRVASEINAIAVACDVASEQEATAAVAFVERDLGAIHVLVNCAGVALGERALGRTGPHPLASFEAVLRTNLIGSFNMVRLVAASMAKHSPNAAGERGVIVNTASAAAFDGQIGQVAYAASKGGVVSMTLPLARELSRLGVRVMCVAPGLFSTPMLRGLPEEVRQSLAQQVPFPSRLGRADEYAALVAHIVENEMLNGETIRLDGALRMTAR